MIASLSTSKTASHLIRLSHWNTSAFSVWRLFPWLLLAAFSLRLTVAIFSDTLWRADESLAYLELAHRLVFGYGFVHEADAGIRTLLIPSIPGGILWLCSKLGLGYPEYYIPAVRAFNATLSLAVPIGSYVLCRRILSENTARAAFVIACFYYEFIVSSAHALAEFYATYFFFAAIALLHWPSNSLRNSAVGILLGCALVFRLHYGFAIALFGFYLLLVHRTLSERAYLVMGGLVAIAVWGLVDRITLGGWWQSAFNYWRSGISTLETIPRFGTNIGEQVVSMLIPSLGIFAIGSIWGIYSWKRLCPVIVPLLSVLFVHLLAPSIHVQYSNYNLAIVLCAVCIADMVQYRKINSTIVSSRISTRPFFGMIIFVLVTCFSITGVLPGLAYTEYGQNKYFSNRSDSTEAIKYLSKLPSENVKVVLYDRWEGVGRADGYYYYLHHNVPFVQPGANYMIPMEQIGYRAIGKLHSSHVITTASSCWPTFDIIYRSGAYTVLANRNSEIVPLPATSIDYMISPYREKLIAMTIEYSSERQKCIGERH